MGVTDRQCRVVRVHATLSEFVTEINGDRLVPVVDGFVANTNPGVDEDRPVGMADEKDVNGKPRERGAALGMEAWQRCNP